MTAQRISQPRDLLYYRGNMKNTFSPQANSVYHQLSAKTHGMEKYLAMQQKS